jgi:hypothetical protein
MTALQTIIKEAKSLKKSFPNRFAKWTDYVKQASAIYASKHKGVSPVGKKKAVKKTAKKKAVKKVSKKETIKKTLPKKSNRKYIIYNIDTKKEYVGYDNLAFAKEVLRDYKKDGHNAKIIFNTKKIVKKKSVKKPSEKDVLKSIQKAEKVQKSHMGVGAISKHQMDALHDALSHLHRYENTLNDLKHELTISKKSNYGKSYIIAIKRDIKLYTDIIKEQKLHITQLKKHI